MEQAALLRKMRRGELDLLQIPESPTDVLMQHIVAACGAEPWREEALFHILRRAYPYRDLTREHFEELLHLLHEGIESGRGATAPICCATACRASCIRAAAHA